MPGMVIQISGDSTQAVASVKSLKNELNNLQREGKVSLASLNVAFQQLKDKLLVATNPQEIAGLNRSLQALRDKSKELASAGAQAGIGVGAMYSGLKSLAFIIPGIGIAGLLNIFTDLIGGLLKTGNAFATLTSIISETKKEFTGAVANVSELRNEIQLAKDGFISKEGVVKHYNDTIGKTTGLVGSLDEAEAGLIKNGGAYIEMTFRKAVATIAYTKAADLAFKVEENRNMVLQGGIPVFLKYLNIEQTWLTAINKENAALSTQIQALKDIGAANNKRAASIGQAFGFNFFQDNKAPKIDKAAVQKKLETWFLDMNLKVPIHPDFLIDVNRIKFILLGGTTQTFAEKVTESINKDIAKLASSKPLAGFSVAFELNQEKLNKIRDQLLELQRMGEFVGQGLADAFGTAFDKIADGENAFKAVGEAIKDLVIQMIKAAIQAFIVKKVLALIGGGPVGLLSSFALGGNAAGGAVSANQPRVIGESGPEIFVPSTSGSIIPNNQIPGMGSGTQRIQVEVIGRLQMREIVLGVARELQYQGANA